MTDPQMDPERTQDTGIPPDLSADEFKDRVDEQSRQYDHGEARDDSDLEDATGAASGPEDQA